MTFSIEHKGVEGFNATAAFFPAFFI